MLKRGIALSFWMALLSGFMTGTTAWAKPADLPSNDHQVECSEGQDDPPARKFSLKLGISSKGITFEVEQGPIAVEPAPAVDALLPAFVEQMLQHAADAISRPERSAELGYLLGKVPYLGSFPSDAVPAVEVPKVLGDNQPQVGGLFERAEYYGRLGLTETARFLYQRVHVLSPTSRLGRLAIERLQELENRLRDDSEQQENPGRDESPEPLQRDVRNGTIPLGLVQVRY